MADASVLVAELLRERGRALFARPDLRVVVAEEQWDETKHELQHRLDLMVDQGRLTAKQARLLHEAVHALVDDRVIEILPRTFYAHQPGSGRAAACPAGSQRLATGRARHDPRRRHPDR